ncbi:hypothetical protein FC32_GL000525 [Ligilactobacillus apodemi DSM 16634 = JCM 16172]|uniref:SpoVT-AbrB domain-containing protein n=1 Tax=Ligilactobacillus apodemi DSM 16634 = JCM 16172 TaxID=1423724 RepID=A0A0R1U0C7_9LACO|nr:hypothetical protein [Ligilactobacillus apodemi]KRL84627.1 hypothetical protein FC32_GL000525 [Ligilactobacillus apodemi DSM 16634 = JCM 16172]MCR1900885.1 AbrB/MazE/SpoVT family DNA-binding domain-containing protein [Ligilactobacillus apodemi]
MIISVRQWGNSKAIRLPKSLLAELGENYESFNVEVENKKLVLTPEIKKEKALDKLFKDYSGTRSDYPFEIVDKGGAVGEELY